MGNNFYKNYNLKIFQINNNADLSNERTRNSKNNKIHSLNYMSNLKINNKNKHKNIKNNFEIKNWKLERKKYDDFLQNKCKIIISDFEDKIDKNFVISNYTINLKNYNKLNYENGGLYEGELENSKRNGFGKLYWNNNCYYSGNWKENLPEGKGIINYENGDILEGIFINGKLNGFSSFYNKEYCFKGNFINDLKDGEGIETYKNVYFFKGSYKENKKEGYGEMNINNLIFYNGYFKNDKISGKGVYIYKNKFKYKGDFLNNKKHGKGIMKYENGEQFIGEFKNDYKDGEGVYIKINCKYIGVWEKNRLNGNVKYQDHWGNKKNGEWFQGKRIRWIK